MEEQLDLNQIYSEITADPEIKEMIKLANPSFKPFNSGVSITQKAVEKVKDPFADMSEHEKLQYDFQKSLNDLHAEGEKTGTNVWRTASKQQLERYTDPDLPFDPNMDMEEMYAVKHGSTMYKAAQQAYATGKSTLAFGLWEIGDTIGKIATGDWENIMNKDLGSDMADVFTQAQLDNPLFFSKDDSEFKKFGHELIAASGSAIGSVVDGVLVSAAMTLGESVVTGGTGSVPAVGMGVARLVSKIKSGVMSFSKASKAIREASEKMVQLNKLNKIKSAKDIATGTKNVSRALMSTYLTVAGEATLQAELNRRNFEDEAIANLYKDGTPTQQQLDDIKKYGDELYSSTWKQNVALVGASTFAQIPGLMKGKMVNSLNANKLFTTVWENGKYVTKAKSIKSVVGKEVFKDALAEGAEEYFQSVIDTATTSYYKDKLNQQGTDKVQGWLDNLLDYGKDWVDYIGDFGEGTVEVAKKGGFREALIGAILGGSMSGIGMGFKARNARKSRNAAMEAYNQQTQITNDFLIGEANRNIELANAPDNEVESIFNDKIRNIAKMSKRSGVDSNRRAYIESFKTLPLEEFKSFLGLNEKVTEELREKTVNDILEIFDTTVQVVDTVDTIFNLNPVDTKSGWFKTVAAKLGRDIAGVEEKFADQIFHSFKDIYIDSVTKNKVLDIELENLQKDIGDNFFTRTGVDSDGLTSVLAKDGIAVVDSRVSALLFTEPKLLRKAFKEFEDSLDLPLPDTITPDLEIKIKSDKELKEKLTNLQSDNAMDKINTIIQHYAITPETSKKLAEYYEKRIIKNLFESELSELKNNQSAKYKEIADFYAYVFTDQQRKLEEQKAKQEAEKKEETIVEKEPTVEVKKATPVVKPKEVTESIQAVETLEDLGNEVMSKDEIKTIIDSVATSDTTLNDIKEANRSIFAKDCN